jgi:hypothetical protein
MMNYFHRITEKSQRLRDFRRSRQTDLTGQQGQALIEYLLMLVMVVILIVGLALALFEPLNNFLANLNKGYIQCLLETGELPKMTSESTATCELPKLTLKNLDGSSQSQNNGNNKNKSENQKGESSSADGSSGTDADKNKADQSNSGPALKNRKSSMIRNGMRTNGTARPELGGDKTTNIPVDDFKAGEGFVSTNAAGRIGRDRQKTKRIDLSGITEYDRRKIEREQEKNRSIAVDSEDFTQNKNKKLTVKPPPDKKISDDDLNVQSDFGSYFKIFFFIIIILFIIILMGSQAMQMTNNSDG